VEIYIYEEITKNYNLSITVTPIPVEDVPVVCTMRGNKRRHACTTVEIVLEKPKEVRSYPVQLTYKIHA